MEGGGGSACGPSGFKCLDFETCGEREARGYGQARRGRLGDGTGDVESRYSVESCSRAQMQQVIRIRLPYNKVGSRDIAEHGDGALPVGRLRTLVTGDTVSQPGQKAKASSSTHRHLGTSSIIPWHSVSARFPKHSTNLVNIFY